MVVAAMGWTVTVNLCQVMCLTKIEEKREMVMGQCPRPPTNVTAELIY